MKPQVAGNMAIGLVSINLSIRTYVPNPIMLNLGLTMSEWTQDGSVGSIKVHCCASHHLYPWPLVAPHAW